MYAVLFDIDGTLLLTGGAGHMTFVETFREVFQLTEFPEGVSFAGRSDRAIAQDIMQRSSIEPSPANWQQFFDDYRQRLERVLIGCEGTVLPGVVDLLDTLGDDQHTTIGLLTGNTSFGAQAKTAAYGLAGHFAFGGYGDEQTERDEIAIDDSLQRMVQKYRPPAVVIFQYRQIFSLRLGRRCINSRRLPGLIFQCIGEPYPFVAAVKSIRRIFSVIRANDNFNSNVFRNDLAANALYRPLKPQFVRIFLPDRGEERGDYDGYDFGHAR